MLARRITPLCALVGLIAVAGRASAETPMGVADGPPELGVARAVDGRTIELSQFRERMVARTTNPIPPPGIAIDVQQGSIGSVTPADVVPVTETQTQRIDVARFVARRVDGRAVTSEVLIEELAKPTPVLLARKGQRPNPVFLQMFKPETLVLLQPAEAPVTFAPVPAGPPSPPALKPAKPAR